MSKSIPHITAAELRILKVLWDEGPRTVRQVKDALAAQGADPLAYTTVMTMMKQLAEKRALDVDRERSTFVYRPTVRRQQILSQRLTQFLHTVFDGRAEDLVVQLAREANLSVDDLRRIEEKIARSERAEKKRKGHGAESKGAAR